MKKLKLVDEKRYQGVPELFLAGNRRYPVSHFVFAVEDDDMPIIEDHLRSAGIQVTEYIPKKLKLTNEKKFQGVTELFLLERRFPVNNGIIVIEDNDVKAVEDFLDSMSIQFTEYVPEEKAAEKAIETPAADIAPPAPEVALAVDADMAEALAAVAADKTKEPEVSTVKPKRK